MHKNILILDDEPDIRELLELTASRMQLSYHSVGCLQEARASLKQTRFDLCLTDMRLPDGNGMELINYIHDHYPQTPIAMITAFGNTEIAVEALKAGAFDFISKPIDLYRLKALIKNALKIHPTTQTIPKDNNSLIGISDPIQHTRNLIHKLARNQAPVLIYGESGTGKELAARLIHHYGFRSNKPFIAINCGAIPTELMESEFFGHIKGSFTGATTDKKGLFEAAEGGTLFLDEISELPFPMQVKLLRAIQERAIRPVGSQHEKSIDVRILSASNRDLGILVSEGQFRSDLYYRVNVIELALPPLRERKVDIPLLAKHILSKVCFDQEIPVILPQTLERLQSYYFPGNIRELENILVRALAFCESGQIKPQDIQLPNLLHSKTATPLGFADSGQDTLFNYLQDLEKREILAALDQLSWDREKTANYLGISKRQLRYRMQRLTIHETNKHP